MLFIIMENKINNDQELLSYYLQRNEKLCEYNFTYLMEHKEIKLLISDYLSNILLHKPDDVFKFTNDYFRILHDDPDTNRVLIVVGPYAVGKSLMIEKFMQEYPGKLRYPKLSTTKVLENYEHSSHIHVEKEEFLRLMNANDLIDHKFLNGEYEGLTRSEVERLHKNGMVSKILISRFQ